MLTTSPYFAVDFSLTRSLSLSLSLSPTLSLTQFLCESERERGREGESEREAKQNAVRFSHLTKQKAVQLEAMNYFCTFESFFHVLNKDTGRHGSGSWIQHHMRVYISGVFGSSKHPVDGDVGIIAISASATRDVG